MDCPNFATPYIKGIKGGVKSGKTFIIRGTVNPEADMFVINLRHRYGVAFHFNPRFNEHQVVNNAWNGGWGPEERTAMPFKRGQTFEIYIHCTSNEYKVSVNDQQLLSFKHRFLELENIDVLEVGGGVQLHYVEA